MFNAGSPRSLRYLLPYFCSLLLLSAGLNAQAQFSGPALSAPAQGNSVQTPTTDLALLNPAAGEVTIVPGDVLSIRLFGSATYAPTVVVGSDPDWTGARGWTYLDPGLQTNCGPAL